MPFHQDEAFLLKWRFSFATDNRRRWRANSFCVCVVRGSMAERIAFERLPEETEPVDYFLDTGEEVPKRPPDLAELFARALAQLAAEESHQHRPQRGEAEEEGEQAEEEDEEEERQQKRERWMKVLASVETATKQLQDVVTTLRRCEAGTFTLAHVVRQKRPPPLHRPQQQQPQQPQHQQPPSYAAVLYLQKRDALRAAAESLREAASRAQVAAATRAEYLAQTAALAQRWRLVAAGAVQQVDCSFCCNAAALPLAVPPRPRRLEQLLPDASGKPTLALPTTEICLALESVTATSTPATAASSGSDAAPSAAVPTTGTASGAEQCHVALSALERSVCAQSILDVVAAEAVRVRQAAQSSLHAVVEGDGAVTVCCSGAVHPHDTAPALRIGLVELPRTAGLPRTTDMPSSNAALVAAAEGLALEQWRWDTARAVRDGAIAWDVAQLPSAVAMAPSMGQSRPLAPKPQRPQQQQQPQQQKQQQQQQPAAKAGDAAAQQAAVDPGRGRSMLETLAVLHSHRLAVFETARVLEQIAEMPTLRGTVAVHWGATTRAPAVTTPFVISTPRRSIHGVVEGPYIRVGTVPIGHPFLYAFIKTLLHEV